ncbi:MAG: hypothetical protein AAFN81_29455, partial [Bacteroidota bacterium]
FNLAIRLGTLFKHKGSRLKLTVVRGENSLALVGKAHYVRGFAGKVGMTGYRVGVELNHPNLLRSVSR